MHLFYLDTCDPAYEPPGFKRASHTGIQFPGNDQWTMVNQKCGVAVAGFHA